MSITAKVHIEHEHLALVPTLQRLDGIKIRVLTQGTTDPGSTHFPFLIEYHDHDALESMLETDVTVDEFELIDRTGDTAIYYIEHTPQTKLISSVVTRENGILVHTETENAGWMVHLLLPDRSALNAIWEYARENDIELDIIEIYSNEDAGGESSYGLTDEQREALQLAFAAGYFNEPRDTSLSEVADEMGLSSTAMSGRLRRGMRNLIAATIAERE
ncbi:helix-turn-helix domain-containing protein [Halobellus rufus]|uniref:helix-turn-helix domain-containing protein n=1 Tax=Halobellus rufus TaxID=1448860 RepID=UPI000679C272|nr:helix-turn-helix domain-containing protein [Halobellus rufus]